MKSIVVRDVGNGLNILIGNDRDIDLIVDFGGDKNLTKKHLWENDFLLSHFHVDHFNGFLKHYYIRYYNDIGNFYYPAMPVFKEATNFLLCLKSLNIRIGSSQAIQTDLFEHITRLNKLPIKFVPIKQGDVIDCRNQKYEILWPPQELKEDETRKEIVDAIKDFEEAKREDHVLRDIYNQVIEFNDKENLHPFFPYSSFEEFNPNHKKIPETTSKANSSLRKAVNRLSVVFRQEDNMLFLGDTEAEEIKTIVDVLEKTHKTFYDVIFASHHGTHWHDSLKKLQCNVCVASLGNKLRKSIKYEYREISNKFIRTDEWGDISISVKIKIK